MKSYYEAEQEVLAEYPNLLKFEGYHHNHLVPLTDFIKGICDLNAIHDTVTNNPVVNYIQCTAGKNRSLGDYFLITKYYYPNVTMKEVRDNLIQLPDLQCLVCWGIGKRIFTQLKYKNYFGICHPHQTDEHGWTLYCRPPEK